VARSRTKYEAQAADWGYSIGHNNMVYENTPLCVNKPEQSGCENVPVEGEGAQPDEEHIAGPGCVFIGGYSGHHITPEDMKVRSSHACTRSFTELVNLEHAIHSIYHPKAKRYG
jgi:hypothetical protein